jgi:hypothetical protein
MTQDKTDLEKFKELFDSVGVSYEGWEDGVDTKGLSLTVAESKVMGYADLITEVHFDINGTFKYIKLID